MSTPTSLPDTTPGTSGDTSVSDAILGPNHYNLRKPEKKVQTKPVNNRPQRIVTKPASYAEPTDESSQDSQVIGKVYTLDSRPSLDSTVEKIIGLSEPLAYRLGAQVYIEAKRRG